VPAAQQPIQPGFSHGRFGTFSSAWTGGSAGAPFPNAYPSGPLAFIPQNAGDTMAEAQWEATCANDNPACQMMPSVNVLYTDVWTDPALATPGTSITYAYAGSTYVVPDPPTSALCQTSWSSSCRIVINYPTIIQPIWDAVRPDPVTPTQSDTCSQAGCHNPVNAAGTAQTPAGNLDLTSSASNVPPQFTSYQQLLFPHNVVMMGANGQQVTTTYGPYLTAGSANDGGPSTAFLGRFASGSGSTHAGWLNIAELRLLSEWLDIGAQYFNDPFAAPAN